MNSRVTIILVIMAIYLAGMLWIGLKGRKYSETNKDFMTAAKQGSMLLVVGSYLGSHLGNGVVVGGAQYGALYGIGGLWYGAGAALSFVLFALVMSKIVYKKGYLTLPDVLSDRYGGKVVSVLIAILHYCTMIAICAGQIMAGRLLFEYVGLPGTAGAAITFTVRRTGNGRRSSAPPAPTVRTGSFCWTRSTAGSPSPAPATWRTPTRIFWTTRR